MSDQSLWNPAWGPDKTGLTRDKADRSDMSRLGAGHDRDNLLEPG
jgi:hypothetical protein